MSDNEELEELRLKLDAVIARVDELEADLERRDRMIAGLKRQLRVRYGLVTGNPALAGLEDKSAA